MSWGISLQHDAIVLLLAFVACVFVGTLITERRRDR